MNREIKFRALINANKTIIPQVGINPFHVSDLDRLHWNWNDVIVMQYTGMKDKDQKEIYEGDIVRIYSKNGMIAAQIKWEQQACQFWAKWKDEDNVNRYYPLTASYGDGDIYMDTQVQVIGNIYENPELIKIRS